MKNNEALHAVQQLEEQLAGERERADSAIQGLKIVAQETEELKLDKEAALLADNDRQELEQSLEIMRRSGMLSNVYREFDLDDGGDVGEDELLARPRLRLLLLYDVETVSLNIATNSNLLRGWVVDLDMSNSNNFLARHGRRRETLSIDSCYMIVY